MENGPSYKTKISSRKFLDQSKQTSFHCRRGQWQLSWFFSLLLCRQQLLTHLTTMSEAFGTCKSLGCRDKEPSRQTTDRPRYLGEHSLNKVFQKTPFLGGKKNHILLPLVLFAVGEIRKAWTFMYGCTFCSSTFSSDKYTYIFVRIPLHKTNMYKYMYLYKQV